jgi:DNA helicase II / ATP-dependent DNA helicase PcrA
LQARVLLSKSIAYFYAVDFLNDLNDAQRAPAAHLDGPIMVIAGAGSGKTRVLTYRVANLIEHGVDPFQILALTFTNKAAREMKGRIGELVGDHNARNIWMGTFHSIFARILRTEADKLNYPKNFTIYDTQDSKSLVKTIIKELNLDDKVYKPGVVFNRISSAKNNLISPQAYMQDVDVVSEDRQTGKPRLGEIYASYANRCFRAGAMDFDDLLFKTNVLLKQFPEVLVKYQHKFRYILVDEYQDTNFSQYLIVKQLAAAHQNLCVVGDDAQSIYAFRGANIQNILNFKSDYPDYGLYKLEQNYRSTQTIVNAANGIIEKNKDQIEKTIWTSNPVGHKIKVNQSISDNEEGKYVANSIYDISNEEKSLHKDFAILYRTNAQSRSFEEALRKLNLPYRIYGGLSFYQRKEIKDLLAYFKLSANPKDEEALKRVINYPARGIGNTTMDKMTIAAAEQEKSLWEIANDTQTLYNIGINKGTQGKLEAFTTMIRSFSSQLEAKPAYELGHEIASSSKILKELYDDKSPEGVARHENIQELLNGMKEFSEQTPQDESKPFHTMSDFLIDVALLTDVDNTSDSDDTISLMTIHSAKGLEFPYVFVVGLEENLFPSQLSINTRAELEEERRLFYVALTRAKKRAILTYATTRYRWGNLQYGEPSRFIEELDPQYLDMPVIAEPKSGTFDFTVERSGFFGVPKRNTTSPKTTRNATPIPEHSGQKLKKVSAAVSSSTDSASPQDIQVGMQVAHAQFGKGKVLSIDDNFGNPKAVVFFPTEGQKQLLLRFAKLKIV